MVTCHETWVHHYDPLTKSESEHWKRKNEPWEKKIRTHKSASEVILIVFSDHKGPLYQHSVVPQMIVNKEYYLEVLKIRQWHVNWKCLE